MREAELEAQRARDEARRARSESSPAQLYIATPPYPEFDRRRGRRHERPWAQQQQYHRWPVNGMRDPRDDTYPLQGYKDPRDWRR